MMMKKQARAFAFVVMTGLSSLASASVSEITTQAAFDAAGTISQNTNFDSTSGFTSLPNPVTYGDLTINSSQNLVVGADTSYAPVRAVLAYNFWTPLPGTISGTHDLFGFNLGYLGQTSSINISLTTNVGSYSFSVANPLLASTGLQFMGFQASAGEYFTAFSLGTTYGPGSAPVITDIQLGVAAVPEPEAVFMLLAGLALLGFVRRRR